jgi:SAM-dependent methyltransferase
VSPCQVCSNSDGNRFYSVREMMLGLRDRHPYLECGRCGCVQLTRVPEDLGRYYPPDYYSLSTGPAAPPSWLGRLRGARDAATLFQQGGLPGTVLSLSFPHRTLQIMGRALARHPRAEARILDVGCGAGRLLRLMRAAGARHTLGIDPYLPCDVDEDGLRLCRAALDQVDVTIDGSWDLIMFNHSFEHLADPAAILSRVERLLAPGGVCVVRIPIAGSYAWRHYREDWVQLDAPRHLFLHTPDSVGRLAQGAGLRVDEVIHDSTAFQFWGSEQYRRDIPLTAPSSYGIDKKRSTFAPTRIAYYRLQARALNALGDGDQAAFLLRRFR